MKKCLLLILVLAFCSSSFSQPRPELNTDSILKRIEAYNSPLPSVKPYLKEIRAIFNKGIPPNKEDFLRLIETSKAKAELINDREGLALTYYYLGKYHLSASIGYSKALPNLLQALTIFEELNNENGISNCYMQMGLISYMTEYYEEAIKNFQLSSEVIENTTSRYLMAISYAELEQYQEAKKHFRKALKAYQISERAQSVFECYMYLGRMYTKEGQLDSAHFFLQKAIKGQASLPGISLSRPFALASEYYLSKGNLDSAEYYALNSLDLSINEYEHISILIASKCLSLVYDKKGDFKNAHHYLKMHHDLKGKDSQAGVRQKITEMQTVFDFKKQMQEEELRHLEEIRKKNRTKNIFVLAATFVLILAAGLWSRLNYMRKSKAELEKEKNISENLLLNILPEEIAEELKSQGFAEARDFDLVSILFTDFKAFTELSAKLSASELVHEINYCFKAFDSIVEKYEIEKIKTIGDAYMAAGGLPVPNNQSVKNTVLAALEMQSFISARKKENDAAQKSAFEMRVGIHSGPVVAGIVGFKKFQYDIWGDTVNTASRMESAGEAEKVNISKATYELIKEEVEFAFEYRGKLSAKGKGALDMWFVSLKG